MLSRVGGLPVHEATLFLARFRTQGRAANTIHVVCTTLALFYRWLHEANIDLLVRLRKGQFLTVPELHRLIDTAQYRADDLSEDASTKSTKAQVIDLHRVRMRQKVTQSDRRPVGVANHATRLRYIIGYVDFLVGYVAADLPPDLQSQLLTESRRVLDILRAQIPTVSRRAKLGAREGISQEDQDGLLSVIHPNSPNNPWKRGFVRHRNWLIVVLLLATGMRRGELLNIQLRDLKQREAKLDIVRRADESVDTRVIQPTPKTRERTIELRPSIMKAVWAHVALRREIKAARKHPYLLASEEGPALAYKTIDKIFADIRRACPSLAINLSSHVMRHTWDDRFSEQAEAMQLSEAVEEKARNEQQGWADNSKSAVAYTRRYAARKGRELSLRLQEKLDVQADKLGASTALAIPLPDRVFSRSGASLHSHVDVWVWTDGPFKRYIDFTRYSGGYERHVLSLKHALITFFKSSSSAHVVNLETAFRYFVELTGSCPAGEFSAANLSNFASKLRPNEAWRIGTLNGLVQKWVALNLPGMAPECATYLAEQRKPGNRKGEAVMTRDPVIGPLSEVEVTALYSAVNAAYGRGHLPLWLVILCRLLLACGGRISQYASLKIIDFSPDTRVLRLPQAKTREDHPRSRFLDFEISPQTTHLLSDYIRGLRDEGYVDNAALFPEDLVMRRGPRKELRNHDDLFFGHCEPNNLSRRFQEEIEEVAPPTPRLDFAPLPVAPKRFRYTFGTRLAEEGASKVVIANRLGHADLQNVDVYFSASPKIVENIDKAMGPLLIPLARAFQGHLVEAEASSTQKGAPGSRIIDFRISEETLGGCSQCAKGCAFNKPVACYTCFRFEPFLDAPHEEVRGRLLKEREQAAEDPRIATINDEAIRAIEEVIALCEQVRQERMAEAEGAA